MSGRKQFNEDYVLDAAMKVFWDQGYKATSLSDLEAATGLNKSSIYNTYQNKEALFNRCLERFIEKYGKEAIAKLDHPDFKTAITGFFDQLFKAYDNPDLPTGCLATMEVGGADNRASELVIKLRERMRTCFEQRCKQAVNDGQLDASSDCAALAAMILSMTRGIAVLNRGYGDLDIARQAINGMLSGMLPSQQ
ncbi:MAG: TetR/AcrR family transcriptional regulator [Porticoccus sp.]|nr:TetR/AcrR family transcriptional regulator [Porticoccus sp.]